MIRNLRTFITAIIFAIVILPITGTSASYRFAKQEVFNVATSEAFQAALGAAKQGDVIQIEAGAILIGNFILPNKTGSKADWITIRSSAADEQLPQPGTRITPAYSNVLPKLISPNTEPVLRTEPGAHHFRFIAIEMTIASDVMLNFGIVRLGEGRETDEAMLPRDILIDRCYIHGHRVADVVRAIALNSANTEITDSYISEIHGIGFDTQAICGWNGPGPFKIINNYLEAAGENVMFGGADPKVPSLVPSDIEFRSNHCAKPLTWMPQDPSYASKHWSIKNLFELKNARRVIIDGNL